MKKITILIVLALLLSGCAALQPPATQSPPEPPAADTPVPDPGEGEPGPEDTSPPEDPAPEEPTPVIPASTSAVCVPPSAHEDLAYTDYATFPQAILDFLNAGASPEELAVSLILQGLGPEEQPVWAEDLTGDGLREVVVTVYNAGLPPEGALLIYDCVGSQYVLGYTSISEQDSRAPRLLHIQDLNADGQREVVYSSTNCGAHTCFEDFQIINWESGVYVPRLEGSTLEYPYPEVKLTDFNHDGIYSLEVTGKVIASVGAGPQRDTINIWDFSPASGSWQLAHQSVAASPFRIHALHDAEATIDAGDYFTASLLFQQIIEDEGLLEWASPAEEYKNLAAYAYFKRIVAAAFLDDLASAQTLFEEMEETFDGTQQYAYLDMAEIFLAEAEATDTAAGCEAAVDYAAINSLLILEPLGSATYGYANPDFERGDICP